MNVAERVAQRLTAFLPSRDRARYAEQWAADLRDADELQLPRRHLLLAACATVISLQLHDVRARGLDSPLPWLAISAVAVAACLYGSATIALATSDGTTGVVLGLAGLVLALVALRRRSKLAAARATLTTGSLLIAEGFAVVWLGHPGQIEVGAGAVLLTLGFVGTVRTSHDVRRPRRVGSLTLLTVGATLVLASLLGVSGKYADYRLNPGGFDCLEGFAGDPGTVAGAPSTATSIRTGFSWNPIGRTCSWGTDSPAGSGSSSTAATTSFQGDQTTSDWISRFGVVGLPALALGVVIGRARTTRSGSRPKDAAL